MKKSNRRVTESILINPKFQFRFIGVMVLLAALVIFTTYAANSYFFWKFSQKGHLLQLPPDHIFFTFLKEQETLMNAVFLTESILVLFLLLFVGLAFSHRIAGPIHKFKKHLDHSAKSGRFKKVVFRKKDFFPELAEAYNRHIPLHRPNDPATKFSGNT